eukprot:1833390-Alexandrium_andersonii.AAC.1
MSCFGAAGTLHRLRAGSCLSCPSRSVLNCVLPGPLLPFTGSFVGQRWATPDTESPYEGHGP